MKQQRFHYEFLNTTIENAIATIIIGEKSYYIKIRHATRILYSVRTQLERIILTGKGFISWEHILCDEYIEIERTGTYEDKNCEAIIKYIKNSSSGREQVSLCNLREVIGSIYIAYLQFITKLRSANLYNAYYKILKSEIIESFLSNNNEEKHELWNYPYIYIDIQSDFNDLLKKISPYYEPRTIRCPIEDPLLKEMAETAKRFMKKASRYNYDKITDISGILEALPHIKLRQDYQLSYTKEGDGCNFNSYLQIKFSFNDVNINIGDITEYFQFDFTPQAIWEFYILTKMSIVFLPKGWHGAYNDHVLISDYKDLANVIAEKDTEFEEFGAKALSKYYNNPIILPDIKLTSPTTAELSATLFTKWGGLQKHSAKVIYNQNLCRPMLSFIHQEEPETLFYYDCGECF